MEKSRQWKNEKQFPMHMTITTEMRVRKIKLCLTACRPRQWRRMVRNKRTLITAPKLPLRVHKMVKIRIMSYESRVSSLLRFQRRDQWDFKASKSGNTSKKLKCGGDNSACRPIWHTSLLELQPPPKGNPLSAGN